MAKEPEIVEMNGASKLQKGLAVALVILSALYTASPVDAASDAVPVLGWIDDIGLMAAAALNAVQQFTKNQNSAMVTVLKYIKWIFILVAVIVALLVGGLIAAIVALIVK